MGHCVYVLRIVLWANKDFNAMSAQQLNKLFQQARAGNRDSEREFFEYLTARFRLFTRHRIADTDDADEIVQEALATICLEYRSLQVESSFAAWAYKVLDNRMLGYLQAQRNRQRRMHGDADLEILPGPSGDAELRRRLLDCLRKICTANRRYGRVVTMHAQGYGTDEICERMSTTANTLYSLLHRGRIMLHRCLETGEVK